VYEWVCDYDNEPTYSYTHFYTHIDTGSALASDLHPAPQARPSTLERMAPNALGVRAAAVPGHSPMTTATRPPKHKPSPRSPGATTRPDACLQIPTHALEPT